MTFAYILGILTGVSLLDIMRRLSMIGWACVFGVVGKPLWRVAKGHPRYHDVLWCTFGGIAFLVLMYGVRAIFAPDSPSIYIGLHILSLAVAISIIFVILGYMRAHRASGHG